MFLFLFFVLFFVLGCLSLTSRGPYMLASLAWGEWDELPEWGE